ncbi:MAG: riboflavin synthase [Proteobacteria bacterium]|nr:riboflavin synthase [Pseudomonadota bacterium]
MFTGIITHIGTVANLEKADNQDLLITIKIADKNINRTLENGCSIACSGACLTLIKKTQKNGDLYLSFAASDETLSKTTIGDWKEGDKVNIEFALRVGDELGGHIVSGHVDDIATIKSIENIADSYKFTISFDKNLAKFICEKGSVTLNGISLTINEVGADFFSVNIIEHTFHNTILQYAKQGDRINLEIDTVARYLNKLTQNNKI